jgi:hypothetical protein
MTGFIFVGGSIAAVFGISAFFKWRDRRRVLRGF